MSNLMWETFVAGLVDEYTHSSNSDRVLWRVVKANRDIVCRERDLCTGNSYVSLELSVAHNGQVFRTEVHLERVAFYHRRRAKALFISA